MLGRSALLAASNSGEPPGFGAKYADPSIRPTSNSFGVRFSTKGDAIAVTHAGSPGVSVYPWSYDSGFGIKYANPATSLPNIAWCVDFHPNDDAIAIGGEMVSPLSPRVYAWSVTGFGSRYANATGMGDYQYDLAFSPSGTRIGVGEGAVYPWSRSSGFGTKYATPGSFLGQDRHVAFSPSEKAVVFGRFISFSGNFPPVGSTLLEAYALTSSGFGARYSNPSDLGVPTANGGIDCAGVTFHPQGNVVFLCIGAAQPRILAYQWSDISGFGPKYSNPALASNYGSGITVSPSGKYFAVVGTGNSSGTVGPLSVYEWSYTSGFGSRVYSPPVFYSPGASNTATGVDFSPQNNAVAISLYHGDTLSDTNSHVYAYKWNDPDPGDIYMRRVALLARFDGSAVDISQNAIALTLQGSASISSQSKFGSGSLSCFANSGAFSSLSDMLRLGKNFTVECWVNPTSGFENNGLFTFGTDSGWSGLSCAIAGGQWMVSDTGSGGTFCGAASAGWQHLVLQRLDGVIRLFVNGVYRNGFANTTDLSGSNRIGIGFYYSLRYPLLGLVGEFRVTNFVARYPIEGFTPPAAQFPYG